MIRALALTSFILTSGVASLHAHHDVNGTVTALTARIKEQPTAALYHQRAVEHRALRQFSHTEADLKSSLELDPHHQPSLATLARLQNQKGNYQTALATAQQLIQLSPAAPYQFLLADLAFDAGKKDLALTAIQKAPPQEDATHLLHAHLLYEKSRYQDAADLLKKAHQKSRSIVLRNAWLDAMIAAKKGGRILALLNQEIATSRFSAAHRIRRAAISNDPEDLELALTEITERINPQRPDFTLINDRRKVYLIQGETQKAALDLAAIQKAGINPVGPWLIRTMPASQSNE